MGTQVKCAGCGGSYEAESGSGEHMHYDVYDTSSYGGKKPQQSSADSNAGPSESAARTNIASAFKKYTD